MQSDIHRKSPVKFKSDFSGKVTPKYFWKCLFTNDRFFDMGLSLKNEPCFCKTGLSLRSNMKCVLLTT